MSDQPPLYLVVRHTWYQYRGIPCANHEERVPVRAFKSKEDAEALRQQLDEEFRREGEPWTWFAETSEFDDNSDALKNLAIRFGLLEPDVRGYSWWEKIKAQPTSEQRAQLWATVPDCKAYEVIETKLLD